VDVAAHTAIMREATAHGPMVKPPLLKIAKAIEAVTA
jgi:hypothetical protein